MIIDWVPYFKSQLNGGVSAQAPLRHTLSDIAGPYRVEVAAMGKGKERPEHTAPPEIFYNDVEARKYTSNSRMIEIQVPPQTNRPND